MKTETTLRDEYNASQSHLYMAFELGEAKWKIGFTIGFGQKPRLRDIKAKDVAVLQDEIQAAKKRFELSEDALVLSCYEAGREGFWLHRYLDKNGIQNLIVDSSSIEVNRKAKRAKTDRLDARKLLKMLLRYHCHGEEKVWSIVNVPDVETEDHRHLHRELNTLKAERTKHINRIKGFLTGQGVTISIGDGFLTRLDTIRLWDGAPLPSGLRSRLEREFERMSLVNEQIKILEAERRELIRNSTRPDVELVRQLMRMKGIGVGSAWLWVMEFFPKRAGDAIAWRQFRNRRQVGALSGLTPTPYQSGDDSREQGISKEGNRYVRSIAIQIAWGWLRYQPESKLTRWYPPFHRGWYQKRFGHGGKRLRKIGIVALARKLLIDCWVYLETGLIPEGVELNQVRL